LAFLKRIRGERVSRPPSRRSFIALAIVSLSLLVPGGAGAATVVNGDFETGNLDGWKVQRTTDAGDWFVYSGEGLGVVAPPSGNFAAVTNETNKDALFLYQDVALEPHFSHQLSLFVYYHSVAPIAVPEPNTLQLDAAEDNQQMRVDVIKPTASLESLAPGDILTTVFANKNGDPQDMSPTRLSVDLAPFAGQTVRIRVAAVAQEQVLNASVDGVSIVSIPPPPSSNAITRGKLTLNKKKGTGRLAITVPGPGILIGIGKGGKAKKVKRAKLTVTGAGTVQLPLKPTHSGKKILDAKGKLKTRFDVFFTPTGGTASAQAFQVTLKKTLAK
jgi:hypothetical protein